MAHVLAPNRVPWVAAFSRIGAFDQAAAGFVLGTVGVAARWFPYLAACEIAAAALITRILSA